MDEEKEAWTTQLGLRCKLTLAHRPHQHAPQQQCSGHEPAFGGLIPLSCRAGMKYIARPYDKKGKISEDKSQWVGAK